MTLLLSRRVRYSAVPSLPRSTAQVVDVEALPSDVHGTSRVCWRSSPACGTRQTEGRWHRLRGLFQKALRSTASRSATSSADVEVGTVGSTQLLRLVALRPRRRTNGGRSSGVRSPATRRRLTAPTGSAPYAAPRQQGGVDRALSTAEITEGRHRSRSRRTAAVDVAVPVRHGDRTIAGDDLGVGGAVARILVELEREQLSFSTASWR